jgi:PAS domain S-box-containing protein
MLNGLIAIGVSGFIPHGHCYLWKPGLVGLHLTSDVLIGFAYLSISLTLVDLVRRIQLPFRSMFLAFGLFIAACGATHFMAVLTLWQPVYWLSGGVKVITALASVATAVLLPPLIPQAVVLVQSAALAEDRRLKLETTNQEMAKLYQQVKELDQLKTQFFANISHDLRTPLTLVLGLTQRLCQQATNPEQAIASEQVNDLVMIDRNARILLKQVNDLLDLAKLEAKKMELCYGDVDLAGVIRLTAAYFETIAHNRQVTFLVSTPPSLSAQVDPEKLERVIINLLSNAFKAVPTGGRVSCRLEKQADQVLITVEDTGPGIAVELRQIIFERFQQGNLDQTAGGTGLGLAIAKEFVELHQGKIAVDTAPGGGASFTVTLPISAPAETTVMTDWVRDRPLPGEHTGVNAAEQAIAALQMDTSEPSLSESLEPLSELSSEPDSRPLVLVVEDNPDMRQFVQKSLDSTYRVVTASDGQQGLEAAIALHPDLVLTDLMMPQMNGDALVRELRSRPELDTTPIVLLTARSDSELMVKLLQAGAQDYLTKPVLSQELQVRVANLIGIKQIREVLQQELATQSQDVEILANTATLSKQELQRALAALRHSESRFRQVTESNMIGILFWDAEGNIIEANDTFLTTFGYTQADLQTGGLGWKEMTPPEYELLDQQALVELRATGTCTPFEKEYLCKDGSRIPVLIGGAMLEGWRDPNPPERGVAFVLDITQRKRTEAALQQAYEQLELRVEQRTQDLSQANVSLQAEIAERQRIEADLRISRESIQKLYEVVADPRLDFNGKVQQLLVMGCERFQLEIGILAELTENQFKVIQIHQNVSSGEAAAIAPDDCVEINNTYCFRTIASNEPISFEQAATLPEWQDHPFYVATRLESYIGTSIFVDGETYGTLSFLSLAPHAVAFSAGDKKFLQLMSQWIGSEISRQQTETALVKEQEFMKVLLDNVNAAIVACDDAGILTLFNRAARDFHGLIEQPLPPEQWSEYYDLYQPDGITPMAKTDIPLFRAWQGERIHDLEMKIVPRSSSPRDILASAQAIADPQSKILGAVAVMHDITARKQAEAQIRILNAELEQRVVDRTAELEAANRAKDELLVREQAARAEAESVNRMKDEFLATLSHELRTPLNAILGWSQLLRNRKFDEATTARALETIERNARSLTQLVGDILEVSSIIRGKVRLNIQPLTVMPLVEAALDSVRLAAEAKAIQIRFHHDQPIEIISGDPDRLQQVFWNLLSNAIKFTPPGGRVEVSLTQTNHTVNIAVSDTGQGISSDFLPRVFDRFRQADGSTNRQHGGLGLGLAIVRHLVELHGGTVWATSPGVGAGATFTVQLPLNSRSRAGSIEPVQPLDSVIVRSVSGSQLTPLANLQILVVEDDQDAREFLTILLEDAGAVVIAVTSVGAAIEVLSETPIDRYPDLLISDIGMPEQDGYTLIRQVRSSAIDRQVTLPAIALTAYATTEDQTQLLQAGFNCHVAKPADPNELMAVITSLVENPDINRQT